MIGIDTNVLVRYFTRDHEPQAQRAAEILTQRCSEKNPGFVTSIVLVELVWTLRSFYDYSRQEISMALEALLKAKEICFEYPDETQSAYRLYAGGSVDFPDALLGAIATARGCEETVTFDGKAARLDGFISADE